ncbi:ankyrin [Aureobasidium pullulans]|nr:ankyrin [Aureobasidium pullulans]
MNAIDPDNPPKPCDYFDVIGGTSTGGLIAIMLGRLDMSVDECIKAYTELSATVFHKKHRIPVNIRANLKERYDSKVLEQAIKQIIRDRNLDENTLLKDPQGTKVFVCCTSGETSQTSLLRSWYTSRGDPDLYRTVRIWEAARATSAASSFFDSISIGDPQQRFLDGGTGANNPVQHVWDEAADLLTSEESLSENVGCLISLGTGQPGYKPFEDTILGIGKTLLSIATETEASADKFHRAQSRLFEKKLCFRFNVPRGLGDIGLAETEQIATIKSMTADHLQSEAVQSVLRTCVERLRQRQSKSSVQKPTLLLESMNKIARDEDHDFELISQDSGWQLANSEDDSRGLLAHISKYQPERVHHKIKLLKVFNTTQWIIKDFESFMSSIARPQTQQQPNQNCLWVSGIIGCGKTFLANTIIQILLDNHDKQSSRGFVAHVYFDSEKRDSLKAADLFRSYVKQFLRHLYTRQQKPPRDVVLALRRMFGSRVSNPSCSEVLRELLLPLISEVAGAVLVVDGLDLCARDEYLGALACFASILELTSAKVVICGRDELDIKNRLPGSIRLEVLAARNQDDIAVYVKHHVEKRSIYDGPISNNSNTVTQIIETLINKANGMFLWARLQIDVLWDTCRTDAEIFVALKELPKDLDETYEKCLERLREKQEPYALRVLRYVYEAKNPLTVDALGEALATDPISGELQSKQIPPSRFIIECGANLVIFDEVERFVVPAHHSVRRFLNSSRARVLEKLDFHVWDDAELKLGEMCILHLCWHMNVAIEREDQTSHEIEATTLRFPAISQMSNWIRPQGTLAYLQKSSLMWPKRSSYPSSPVLIKSLAAKSIRATSASNASMLWKQFWSLVLGHPDDPQICPWSRSQISDVVDIIWWAIDHGHLALLNIAMEKSLTRDRGFGPDFRRTHPSYGDLLPLHLAAKRGSCEIFERVMQRCDLYETCGADDWSAMHYAVQYGHSDIVSLLWNKAPHLAFVPDSNSTSPLRLSIMTGSLENVRALEQAWTGAQPDVLYDLIASNQVTEPIATYILKRSYTMKSNYRYLLAKIFEDNLPHLIPSVVAAGLSSHERPPANSHDGLPDSFSNDSDLASLVLEEALGHTDRNFIDVDICKVSWDVSWLLLLMTDSVIEGVKCVTCVHDECSLAAHFSSVKRQKFLHIPFHKSLHHECRIRLTMANVSDNSWCQMKILAGDDQLDDFVRDRRHDVWKNPIFATQFVQEEAILAKFVWHGSEMDIGFSKNPCNAQHLRFFNKMVQWSNDGRGWEYMWLKRTSVSEVLRP